MEKEMAWKRVPALQSPWFIPHVTAYMLSYALATVAFVLTIVRIVRMRILQETEPVQYDSAGYQVLKLAFPFMTFGLLSGAVWAEAAWGVYWSWDPKETWSLITWLVYAIMLHTRYVRGWRGRRMASMAIIGFLCVIITYLGVNYLPGLHSYQ